MHFLPAIFLSLFTFASAFLLVYVAVRRFFFQRRIALPADEDEGTDGDRTSSWSLHRGRRGSVGGGNHYREPDAAALRNANPLAIATHMRSLAFERSYLPITPASTRPSGFGRGWFRRGCGVDEDGNGSAHGGPAVAESDMFTPEQKQTIEELGVAAWEFLPDFELNCLVREKTEVSFLEGEGGCVQTNLPIPKSKEIYYWEVKFFEKPSKTSVSVGLATKPYPNFRYPGWNRFSVGYQSDDGRKYNSDAFAGRSYGKPYHEGDVVGIGYRPASGIAFFTRNGVRLEEAASGMKQALFPTIACDGPCVFHVNLGQLGFVFIEANVKKWVWLPLKETSYPLPLTVQHRIMAISSCWVVTKRRQRHRANQSIRAETIRYHIHHPVTLSNTSIPIAHESPDHRRRSQRIPPMLPCHPSPHPHTLNITYPHQPPNLRAERRTQLDRRTFNFDHRRTRTSPNN